MNKPALSPWLRQQNIQFTGRKALPLRSDRTWVAGGEPKRCHLALARDLGKGEKRYWIRPKMHFTPKWRGRRNLIPRVITKYYDFLKNLPCWLRIEENDEHCQMIRRHQAQIRSVPATAEHPSSGRK